jgi:spermidine synthase
VKTTRLPHATLSEHDGVRYLHLDTPWVQGAMRLARPNTIELEYVQRMLTSLLWRPTEALSDGHALQLGLGAGSITRFALNGLRMPTTVVELNPEVVAACHAWFRLPRDSDLLDIQLADAGAWVAGPAGRTLHGEVTLLHVDLYDHEAAAPVLDDEGFYAACQKLLAPGGLMAVNLFGRDHRFEQSLARVAAAFGSDQVWHIRPTREGNTVVVAGRDVVVPGREALKSRALALEHRFLKQGLRATQWLHMVRPYQPPTLPAG